MTFEKEEIPHEHVWDKTVYSSLVFGDNKPRDTWHCVVCGIID